MIRSTLNLVGLVVVCEVAHQAVRLGAAADLSLAVEEVNLFIGPRVVQLKRRGVVYRLNAIPRGGSVKFAGEGFNALPPLKRLVIMASPEVALIALACLCLGPSGALQSVLHGFGQVIRGALNPVPTGQSLFKGLVALIGRRAWPVGLGVVAAKHAALNLLPLPPNDGGQILLTLLQWRKRLPDRVLNGIIGIGLLAILGLTISWAITILRVVVGR